MRKYTCDDNFFSRDTPEAFYWAGFIAADGCLYLKHEKNKKIQIGLSIKDIGHLYKFKLAINFDGKITYVTYRGKYGGAAIGIYSSKMFDDLESIFGLHERKSLAMTFPKNLIDNTNISHFMRGYFDGDGSINQSKGYPRFGLRGTVDFLNTYNDILKTNCVLFDKRPKQYDSIGEIQYMGYKAVSQIKDFLYQDAFSAIYLDRKYNRFLEEIIKEN